MSPAARPADHMPTHRAARDTDDAGHVWLHQGRSDFWGPQTPGREGGSSAPWLPAPGRATKGG